LYSLTDTLLYQLLTVPFIIDLDNVTIALNVDTIIFITVIIFIIIGIALGLNKEQALNAMANNCGMDINICTSSINIYIYIYVYVYIYIYIYIYNIYIIYRYICKYMNEHMYV
jgi:hypothetical protein